PDGRTLASGEYRGAAHLLEVATGKQRLSVHPEADEDLKDCEFAFSPDGNVLVTWTREDANTARLWDTLTGKEIGCLDGHRGAINQAAFAPDGKTLATASEDTTILLWDISGLVKRGEPVALTAEALSAAWDDLAAADAVKARIALASLRQADGQAVEFLRGRLRPAQAPPAEHVSRWLKDLDSDDF